MNFDFSASSGSVYQNLLKEIGDSRAQEALAAMLLIRHFETRGEAAYQQGFIGGFYHSYAGQEAIQTAIVQLFGQKNWYVSTYRCHALALLLGATPSELMAELFGRATGNAQGRGGSMHLYTERMLGGFAIVGGHVSIAAGAAFSSKYLNKKDEVAICFLGDGAVAQGSFHETLNLSALWNLPVLFVVENNQWGMGTHVSRAICTQEIAKKYSQCYDIEGFTVNGMDYFDCYVTFRAIRERLLKEGRPILVECCCERFRGHSISDPALYRSKEALKELMSHDPILSLSEKLQEAGLLSRERYQEMDRLAKESVLEAVAFAKKSPWPALATLGEGVYAP